MKKSIRLSVLTGVSASIFLINLSPITVKAADTTNFTVTQSKVPTYHLAESKFTAHTIGGSSIGGTPDYNNVTHIPGWLHDSPTLD